MRAIIFFLMILWIAQGSYGQPDSIFAKRNQRTIGVDMGVIHSRLIDEGLTSRRLFFRGPSFKFRIDYSATGENYKFTSAIELSAGKVKTTSGELPTEIYAINIALDYLRKIKQYNVWGSKSELFGGIELSSMNYGIINEAVLNN